MAERSDYEAGYDMGVATCKAEIERLRAALQQIADAGWGISETGVYGIARAALRGEEG